MLGKLIKHEAKATARIFLPLLALLVAMSLFNKLLYSFVLPIRNDDSTGLLNLMSSIFTALYVFLVIGVFVLTLVVLIQRFYKNLLGDEGYLMFTLPVPIWQHVTAKTILATFWSIVNTLVAGIAVLFLIASVDDLTEPFRQLQLGLNEVASAMGIPIPLLVIEGFLFVLTGIIASLLQTYLAIAVGSFFQNHRLLGSFVSYMAINTVLQIISGIGVYIVSRIVELNLGIQDAHPVFLLAILSQVVLSVGFFFATERILSKKLNLA